MVLTLSEKASDSDVRKIFAPQRSSKLRLQFYDLLPDPPTPGIVGIVTYFRSGIFTAEKHAFPAMKVPEDAVNAA